MNSAWTSHLRDKDEKEKFQAYVSSSVGVLDRLTELIQRKLEEIDCPTLVDYDVSSWAFKQADRIGQARAYKEILKLTDLKGTKNDHLQQRRKHQHPDSSDE